MTEKQTVTDMLGDLAEDRFFARRSADERRALRDLERNLSTGRQQAVGYEGLHVSPPSSAVATYRRWAWGLALTALSALLLLFWALQR